MAKGNMLLGYSRGSVGDVVMSRVKGQQVAKARNRKPANPKTNKQMLQRSSFISPVKFFTHGVQALFKFAFSDKKTVESDFNAFMRNNAKASFPVTKAENDNPGFPALGDYMMTKGKLAEIPVSYIASTGNQLALVIPEMGKISTIAQLSAAMVAANLAEEGDIITFVGISEQVTNFTGSELVLTPGESPKWEICQFIVDSSNPASIVSELPGMRVFAGDDGDGITFVSAEGAADKTLFAMAVVRSKETALGLEVSNTYLKNGGYIDAYINYRRQDAQVAKVLADWGATGEAILQGSIAKK